MTTPEIHLPRPLLWPIAAIGTALGWVVGRSLVVLGWVAGRAFLIGAYFAESVVYGFRMGAMIGPKQLPDLRRPRPPDNSKVLLSLLFSPLCAEIFVRAYSVN